MMPLSPVAGGNCGLSGAPFMNGPRTGVAGAVKQRSVTPAIRTPTVSPLAHIEVTMLDPATPTAASSIKAQAGIHRLRKYSGAASTVARAACAAGDSALRVDSTACNT